MSKKCPKCESKDIHITYYPAPTDSMATCYGCGYVDLLERFPEQTVFDHITQSEEALAERLVYYEDVLGIIYWFSTILPKERAFLTKSRAFAATVTELLKEYKEQSK